MEAKTDRAGQIYFEVENMRITVKKLTWEGNPGLSIRAYQSNGRLYKGAEIPIRNKEVGFDLIMGFSKALEVLFR